MGVRGGAVQSGGTVGADARQEGAQARPKLLVVEDDPNIVELLSASLRFAGFDVTAATNGAEAVASARESAPDLMVLDVMLPDLDGFEVIRRLREGGVRRRSSSSPPATPPTTRSAGSPSAATTT